MLGSRVTPGAFLYLLELGLALSSSLGPARHPKTHYWPWIWLQGGSRPCTPWGAGEGFSPGTSAPPSPPILAPHLGIAPALELWAQGCPILAWAGDTWYLGGTFDCGILCSNKACLYFYYGAACILLPSVLLPSAGVATAELSPSPTAVAGGGCKGKAAPLPLPQPPGRAGMLKARGGSPFVAAFPFQGQQRATTKQRMPPLDPGNNAVAMDSRVSWGHGAGPAAPPVLWVSRVPPCGSGPLALPWGRRAVGCSESLWRVPLGAGRRAIYEVPCCPLLQHGRDKGMGSTDLGCRVNTGCWLLRHRLPAYPAARAAGGIRGPG